MTAPIFALLPQLNNSKPSVKQVLHIKLIVCCLRLLSLFLFYFRTTTKRLRLLAVYSFKLSRNQGYFLLKQFLNLELVEPILSDARMKRLRE